MGPTLTRAWRAYHKALVEAGLFVGGDPLQVPDTGTTIRIKDGKRHVQDGPYADAKEQLGGFTILEAPSLDAALEWGSAVPGILVWCSGSSHARTGPRASNR